MHRKMQSSRSNNSPRETTIVELELKDPGYDDDPDWWKEEYE